MGISLRLDFIERTITATHKQQSKMQTFHYSAIALLFACVALCASQNQEVPPKEVCEADVDDCVSSNPAFKCAMMFKNLTDLPLKVLDIIPDLIIPKFWFTALVEIGAYVSYCGTSWQE